MTSADNARVPRHIAIVMDGNGRWAKLRHRPRTFGHNAGRKAVRTVVEACLRQGVKVLTLFAFSSENWQRPQDEVGALMELFVRALDKEVDELHGNGVRLRFVGDLASFEPGLRQRMLAAMARTAGNDALHLNVAVSYGGRWDIVQAARKAAESVARGELRADEIDENLLGHFMCLADLPRFIKYARNTAARYRQLGPLMVLLDEIHHRSRRRQHTQGLVQQKARPRAGKTVSRGLQFYPCAH